MGSGTLGACEDLLKSLLPHLSGVLVEQVSVESGALRIVACTRSEVALPCPGCGVRSRRRHSGYGRMLADGAVGGRMVVISLEVRRLFCDNSRCERVTFAEQVEGLTERYQRRTPPLDRLLAAIGIVLWGLPGARLAALLPAPVSRTTMLRLVMLTPDPGMPTPRVLGVDDFAFKRSHVYGSVLVDCETGAPVDLLEDREADTFARWFTGREGIEAICRDRAGAYASAACAAAPDAVQIADRWHVWQNLCDTVEKAIGAHRGCLDPPDEPLPAPVEDAGRRACRLPRPGAGTPRSTRYTTRVSASTTSLPNSAWTARRYAATPRPPPPTT